MFWRELQVIVSCSVLDKLVVWQRGDLLNTLVELQNKTKQNKTKTKKKKKKKKKKKNFDKLFLSHYENTPIQYNGSFYGCKNEKIHHENIPI